MRGQHTKTTGRRGKTVGGNLGGRVLKVGLEDVELLGIFKGMENDRAGIRERRVYEDECHDLAMSGARLIGEFKRLDLVLEDIWESYAAPLLRSNSPNVLHKWIVPTTACQRHVSLILGLTGYLLRLKMTSMPSSSCCS